MDMKYSGNCITQVKLMCFFTKLDIVHIEDKIYV